MDRFYLCRYMFCYYLSVGVFPTFNNNRSICQAEIDKYIYEDSLNQYNRLICATSRYKSITFTLISVGSLMFMQTLLL